MHARIAMILSVSGVLVAGTAAAVVNSEVLRQDGGATVTSPQSSVTSATAATTSSTPATSPSTPPASNSTSIAPTLPSTSASTPASSSTVTVATVPSSVPNGGTVVGTPLPGSPTQQAFRLGDAATAVLDTANGQLTIVSVAPHPGWALDRAEQEDSTSVEIRLESATGEVRFEASLVRGVVVVSLRNEAETSSTSSTPNTGVDDDDNSGPGRATTTTAVPAMVTRQQRFWQQRVGLVRIGQQRVRVVGIGQRKR